MLPLPELVTALLIVMYFVAEDNAHPQQLPPENGIGRSSGEEDVAPTAIELPGEGIEATHGPVDLHGVAVLFESHPARVAGRLLRGEQPHGLADVAGRHPGERLERSGAYWAVSSLSTLKAGRR
jgi:hypothetical protein